MVKPKPKPQARKKRLRSKKKSVKTEKVSAKQPSTSQREQEFARTVWRGIGVATKFVHVPEFQSSVTYSLPSGEAITATLKWYTVSHGPRIFGHYDDQNDVCYIGEFIEG